MDNNKYENRKQELINLLNSVINEVLSVSTDEYLDSVHNALDKLLDYNPMVAMDIFSKLDEIPGYLVNTDEKYFNTQILIDKLGENRPENNNQHQVEYLAYKLYIAVFQQAEVSIRKKNYKKVHMDSIFLRAVEKIEAIQISRLSAIN